MVSIVSSLGAPLIPSVARSLGVSLDSAHWSLTSALLAGAVAAPILGRLGDGPYRREAILGGLAVVTAGGVVAGAADSLAVLIAGRAMQGVGLGLAPITMAAARDHLPAERAAAVIGTLSVTGAAGVGAGYPISGFVAAAFGVSGAFLFGAIMSAVALAAAFVVIPSSRQSSRVPLDVTGAVVLAAGLVSLLLAIAQGERWGWTSPEIIGLFAAAVVILALWALLQLRRDSPLVDLRQLRHRAVLTADLVAVMLGVALYMFLTLVTEFVQAPDFGFSTSTLVAGLCLVPFSIFSLTASRAMVPLLRLLGTTAMLVGGSLVITASGVFFALAHSALWQAFAAMGVLGVGFGLTFAAIPGLISRAVPDEDVGSALGFYQVIRAVGFSIGSALTATILADHIPVGALEPTEQGYVAALWVGAGVCAAAAVVSAVLAGPGDPSPNPHLRDDAELASAGLTGVDPGHARRPRAG